MDVAQFVTLGARAAMHEKSVRFEKGAPFFLKKGTFGSESINEQWQRPKLFHLYFVSASFLRLALFSSRQKNVKI